MLRRRASANADARRRRYRQAFRDAGRRAHRRRPRLARPWRRASSWRSSARPAAASRRCSTSSAGCSTATRARVEVAGERCHGPHASIGMVFQEESTFPWRTVIDNVAFPLEIAGMPKARALRARAAFRRAGRARRLRAALSGRALGRHAPARGDRAHARRRSRRSC